jgi:FMN phosphatase YigB (HAD superfamily)
MKKVLAVDIDGTLINDTKKTQATIDRRTGQRYSVEEFRNIPDRYADMSRWDFHEWEDKALNIQSILSAEPIQGNIDKVEAHRRAGYDIVYITSRGGGDTQIEKDINIALSTRLGFDIKGYALGDFTTYGKDQLPVKKQTILRSLQREYDEVVFMDDEEENIKLAMETGVNIIHALKP